MSDGLVTVAAFDRAFDARLAQGRLEAEGIDSVIADEHLVTTNWLYANLAGGVKVQVREADATRARQVLQAVAEGAHALEEDIEVDEPRCPACDATAIHPEPWSRRVFFLSILLLGFPLLFRRRTWRCTACGHAWQE